MLKPARFVVALSLLLSLASYAAGAPHGSMSHGFSSHASSSSPSASRASSAPASSGFGTFGRQASAPPPSAPASASGAGGAGGGKTSGGFGSFNRNAGGAAPRQSDSALSQQLGRDAAQANALRTLDGRRAGTAANAPANPSAGQAANGMPPAVPGYPQGMPAPQGQQGSTTIIVNQDRGSGLGNVVAGAMIANSMQAHARAGSYPPYNDGGTVVRHGGASGGSFFGLVVSLIVIAALAWLAYAVWKRVRAARAATADKPNYSFERN